MISLGALVKSREAFNALTKDGTLQPYIADQIFRSSNVGIDVGDNLHVFDKRYRNYFTAVQPKK